MRAVSEWLEMILIVLLLGGSVVGIMSFMNAQDHGIVETIEDKTAFTHDTMLYAPDSATKGSDLMMAISVIDEFTPFPRRVTWDNSKIWVLDSGFVADRWNQINNMYKSGGGGGNLVSYLERKVAYTVYMYPGITSFTDENGVKHSVSFNSSAGSNPYVYYIFA
jgi:hypothetical protein